MPQEMAMAAEERAASILLEESISGVRWLAMLEVEISMMRKRHSNHAAVVAEGPMGVVGGVGPSPSRSPASASFIS
ncbi:hypothetical protein HPP92_012708 [Vanilla planifolia]|uniref:Uncharacterized protein n=1 Tax=Vanilla planifolia TaxID=51239 RepID=A0A835QR48_VANPL|nr:hypothetical protein HPP92_013134 [Vanilla planifolia]KAG0477989.1 hypothetical protein HPP92_012708 [Vanilla planifolia]